MGPLHDGAGRGDVFEMAREEALWREGFKDDVIAETHTVTITAAVAEHSHCLRL